MIEGNLTPPRRRALVVLAKVGRARISNATSAARRTVYWQTAQWLVRNGLAEDRWRPVITLTPVGREVAGHVRGDGAVC